jgi:pantoate--beta-alanine ligase
MGALHQGHIALIRRAREESGLVVCSIFINPTQFNDPKDFQKYPVTIEEDIYQLEVAGTDILFLPSVEALYPKGTKDLERYDLGYLENILEGYYRPGHYQGVCQVMSRLLKVIAPDLLFMGQKDYQQCMVVNRLIQLLQIDTNLVACPTVREADGLAMSSRNKRLDKEKRKNAVAIYNALKLIKENFGTRNIKALVDEATELLKKYNFKPDYVAVADASTLELINEWDGQKKLIALIAAFQEDVRLIDNLLIN